MLIHMIFGQYDGAPTLIDAWDEITVEGNPDGFQEALHKAQKRVYLNDNGGDLEKVAVVVVAVNTSQIDRILNPPNKVMGEVQNDD